MNKEFEGQQQDERVKFEAWKRKTDGEMSIESYAGRYDDIQTQAAWEAWQARASWRSAGERQEARAIDPGQVQTIADRIRNTSGLPTPSSPPVEIGTDFSQASVDTPELRRMLDVGLTKSEQAGVIAHIKIWRDQHTAQAVKAEREKALEEAAQVCETQIDWSRPNTTSGYAVFHANAIRALRTPQPAADTEQGAK